MPRFLIKYTVTTVFASQIEIEADNEDAADAAFNDMDPGELEKRDGQIESYTAEITDVDEVK